MTLMQDWHENSIKKAFLILDEPPHGKQYMGDAYYPDDHPEGSLENLDVAELTKEFKEKKIEMTIFQLNDTLKRTIEIM